MKDEIEFRPIPDNQVGIAFEDWCQSEEGQAFTANLKRQEKLQSHCDGIRQQASGFEHSPGRTVFRQSSFDQPLIGKRLDLLRFEFKGKTIVMPVNEFLERMAATKAVEKHVREGFCDEEWASGSSSTDIKLTVYSEDARAVAMVRQEKSWGWRASFTDAYQGNSTLAVHENPAVRQQKTVVDNTFLDKYGIEPGTQRVIRGIKLPFRPLEKRK